VACGAGLEGDIEHFDIARRKERNKQQNRASYSSRSASHRVIAGSLRGIWGRMHGLQSLSSNLSNSCRGWQERFKLNSTEPQQPSARGLSWELQGSYGSPWVARVGDAASMCYSVEPVEHAGPIGESQWHYCSGQTEQTSRLDLLAAVALRFCASAAPGQPSGAIAARLPLARSPHRTEARFHRLLRCRLRFVR
jgi:hypothetical protein